MARAPLQVIVIPFRRNERGSYEYAVFHRADGSMWQFVSGGAEDSESAFEAAVREAGEEAAIPPKSAWVMLDSKASVARTAFPSVTHWPADLMVVPEHAFAVEMAGHTIRLSDEHDEVRWLPFDEAMKLLTWESNRLALRELDAQNTNAGPAPRKSST